MPEAFFFKKHLQLTYLKHFLKKKTSILNAVSVFLASNISVLRP